MYLLDTNVVSELRKVQSGKADANVAVWASQSEHHDLFVSVVTIEELEIGCLRVERRDQVQGSVLRAWLEDRVLQAFEHRILPIDLAIVRQSAKLHVPDRRPTADCLIAATAIIHGMTIVTRNVADFQGVGAPILNPWSPS